MQAIQISFVNISNDSGIAPAIAAQLFADVTDYGSGQVLFTVSNLGPLSSVVTRIYWDDDAVPNVLASIFDIFNAPPDVVFTQNFGPPNLPGGEDIGFYADYMVGATPPPPNDGLNPGESVGILFTLAAGKTFGELADALFSGQLRLGLHVQGLGDNDEFSDSFVSTEIPEPSTLLLLGMGMVGLVFHGRRRRLQR